MLTVPIPLRYLDEAIFRDFTIYILNYMRGVQNQKKLKKILMNFLFMSVNPVRNNYSIIIVLLKIIDLSFVIQ